MTHNKIAHKQNTIKRAVLGLFFVILLAGFIQIGLAASGTNQNTVSERISNLRQPTDTDTLSPGVWKSFQDKELGFSISYPGDWMVEDVSRPEHNNNPLKALTFRPVKIPETIVKLGVDIETQEALASVASLQVREENSESVAERIISYEMTNTKRQKIRVSEADAIRIEGDSRVWDELKEIEKTQKRVVVIVPNGVQTITFSYIPKPVTGEDYTALFTHMLQSIILK